MSAAIDHLFTRNNIVWTVTLVGSLLAFVAAHTSLIPSTYVEHVKDVATVLGFLAGKLSTSPLPHSSEVS